MTDRRVAIVSPLRTPVGRFLGTLTPLPAEALAADIIRAVVERSGVDPQRIDDVVLAGGVESMSNIEYYTTAMRGGARSGSVTLYDRLDRGRERSQPEARFGHISGMIETAENLAREYQISREASDQYAVQSHQRAHAAAEGGRFRDEMIPVRVPQRRGDGGYALETMCVGGGQGIAALFEGA